MQHTEKMVRVREQQQRTRIGDTKHGVQECWLAHNRCLLAPFHLLLVPINLPVVLSGLRRVPNIKCACVGGSGVVEAVEAVVEAIAHARGRVVGE